MTSVLDTLIGGYQNDRAPEELMGMPGVVPAAAPQVPSQGQADPTKAQGLNILEMLAQTGKAPPAQQMPPVDTSMLGPLALLHFASAVTRPKGRGESTMGRVLDSVAGSAQYAMATKGQMEDRATAAELKKRQFAAADMELEKNRVGLVGAKQKIIEGEEQRPLELQRLRLAIEKGTNDVESSKIETKIKAIQEKYAEQVQKATLEEKAAKTDEDKADAMMKKAHAELYARQAKELLELARIRKGQEGKDKFNYKEGLPGEPVTVINERTGQLHYAPMSPADALNYATRQVEAREKMGEFKEGGKIAKELALKNMYMQYLQGTIPQGKGGDPSAPAKPASTASGQAATPAANDDAAGFAAAKREGVPKYDPRTNSVYLPNGRKISKEEYEALRRAGQPQAQTAPGMGDMKVP